MASSSDPVAALSDAWRRAREALSFSSVRGREVTGTHHLHIGGYSTVDSVFSHGKGIDSRPFRAGGHRWQLSYYPNGIEDTKTTSGCRPAFALRLMDNRFLGSAADATAKYDVSVLDSDGDVVYRHCHPGAANHYSLQQRGSGCSSGYRVDLREDEAAALLQLKDDRLVVQCDVTVQKLEKESRVWCFLRSWLD